MDKELLVRIEKETGFSAFENAGMVSAQYMFYGTSDKYAEFKTLIGTKAPNGCIAYLMDTGESHMYSRFKNTWY